MNAPLPRLPSGKELAERASAIRLSGIAIANATGLNKHTVYNLADKTEGREERRTVERVLDCIEREEERLLVHLLKRRGIEKPEIDRMVEKARQRTLPFSAAPVAA